MSTWEQLDTYLRSLTGQIGGARYIFSDAGKLQLSPSYELPEEIIARFDKAASVVRAVFGPDCLKTARWKRYFNDKDSNRFVAEPVLSAYHLIVLFESWITSTEQMFGILDGARPILAAIITGLPPLDGGPRALGAERSP